MEPVRKSLFGKKSSTVSHPETFAMRVESYDVKAKPAVVKGHRVDTQEPVTVYLRDDISFNNTGRFKRSEVADFAAPRKDRQHPGTTLGGILLVQEAVAQGNNTFGARWMQSLSHNDGEAEVFLATVHVSPVKRGAGGKDYSLMTVMFDGEFGHLSQEMCSALRYTPPFKVDSMDELKVAVTQLLEEGVGVGVRFSNAETFDALYLGRKKDTTVAQIVDNFMNTVSEVKDAVNSGEFTCEVVPYGNVWGGPSTVEIMTKNKVIQSRLARFNEQATATNGKVYPVSVFRPAIIATRLTKEDSEGNRSVFFSHFEPLFTRQPIAGLVNAIAHAHTEHLAPEPPKPVASPTAAPVSPAAAASAAPHADSGYGESFDGSYTDDDLMSAASAIGNGRDIGEDVPPAEDYSEPQQAPAATPAPRRWAGRKG